MARNAGEIADSDGESDVDITPSFPEPQDLPPTRNGESSIPEIDLGVNFDQFLGQSQIDDLNQSQHSILREELSAAADRSTGTTASLKRQIESEQRKIAMQKSSSSGRHIDIMNRSEPHSSDSPVVAKTKRRHSELLTTGQMDGVPDTKRKRQKRYGSSSSQLRTSQSDIFMSERYAQDKGCTADQGSISIPVGWSDQPENSNHGADPQADFIDEMDQGENQQHLDPAEGQLTFQDQDDLQQPSHGVGIDTEAFKEYMQQCSGHVSMSRSLMGTYESINLDFSGNGSGLDVHANPFGDPSQNSPEDGHGQAEQTSLEENFRPSITGSMRAAQPSSKQDSGTYSLFEHGQSGSVGEIGRREARNSQPNSARSKSYIDPSVITKYPPEETQELSLSMSTSSRKRRKTDEGLALNVGHTTHQLYDPHPSDGALDSAQAKVDTQGKKRGRKPKNHVAELRDEPEPEQGKAQDNNEKTSLREAAPMDNQISSEPQLDDEAAIGLPQEQYKPRPSRSRSKRTAEEEMPPPAHTPVKAARIPTKQALTPTPDEPVQPDNPEDTPLTKLKKEKRKKNKMKRAKTSAAALLKKSDKMLSDGEEDVVWVETKPAIVHMKVPDPLEVKREEHVEVDDPTHTRAKADLANTKEVTVQERSSEGTPRQAAELTVEVPKADDKSATQVPKKRGRKKKVAPEIPPSNEKEDDDLAEVTDLAAETNDPQVTEDRDPSSLPKSGKPSSRQSLKEKDINTSHPTQQHPHQGNTDDLRLTTPSPSKQDSLQTSHPPSAQARDSVPPPPQPEIPTQSSTEKGPMKHSPIKPTGGGRIKYRVGLSRRAAIPPLLKIVRK